MSATMIAHAHRRGRRLVEALPPADFTPPDFFAGFDAGLANVDPPASPSADFQRGWSEGQALFREQVALIEQETA